MKLKATVKKDPNGRVTQILVKKGRQKKGIKLDFEYGQDGFVREFLFDGKKEELPSIPEIIALVNESFIERIGTVKVINLLEVLEVIEKIETIENIENVKTVAEVTKTFVYPPEAVEHLSNRGFETGDFTHWNSENGHGSIDNAEKHSGSYSWKSHYHEGINQNLDENVAVDNLQIAELYLKTTNGYDLLVQVVYTDDTTTNIYVTATSGDWQKYDFLSSLTTGKTIKTIKLKNYKDTPEYAWMDDLSLLEIAECLCVKQTDPTKLKATVTQGEKDRTVTNATRTNLKNQPEREDLLVEDKDFSTSATPQEVLGAVAGQKHKVYAFGFECDADGTMYEFQGTVATATKKFGRRTKKGVYGQTLLHPIVCDVNTALKFLSNGGNTKLWVQYKTEA